MPLKHVHIKRLKGVTLRSGYFYKFRYHAWHNDKNPTVIFMSAITGMHSSGHQWRLIQCINFTYIPRAMRKRFLKSWMKELDRKGKKKFTWDKVISRYPYLKPAVRRYLLKPVYYIKDLQEIPLDDVERVVVSTMSRDFSKRAARKLRGYKNKFIKALFNRKKKKKKRKK